MDFLKVGFSGLYAQDEKLLDLYQRPSETYFGRYVPNVLWPYFSNYTQLVVMEMTNDLSQ